MNAPHAQAAPADERALTDYRLERIEKAVATMAESMQNLVTLEQKHAETRDGLGRAFKANEATEQRVRVLEVDMAVVKQSRGWAGQAIVIVTTAFVTAIAAVLVDHVMK